ncbi:MAG: hypothetical protein IPH10_06350 [bacterium]|nr:hypothetical protein [bacterium]
MKYALWLLLWAAQACAVEWDALWVQPGVARDLALGSATGALFGSYSTASQNPAAYIAFPPAQRTAFGAILIGNGVVSQDDYRQNDMSRRSTLSRFGDFPSFFIRSLSFKHRWLSASVIPAEPVMRREDPGRLTSSSPVHALAEYQSSVMTQLLLHPRVQVGGRVDFYSRDFKGDGEGFSYGVILKPHGVQVGLHYQRFPVSGPRWLHPLDRRVDQGTTASLALQRQNYSVAVQVTNLSRSDELGFLEPRAGAEWRPARAIALRAGGSLFTRSHGAVATFGVGLLDANWFRARNDRLPFPEDILSIGVALLYNDGHLNAGHTAVTLAWRL